MAKDKTKKKKVEYNVKFIADSIRILEKVLIISMHIDCVEVSYRRKGSSLKDVQFIPKKDIIAIIGGDEKEGSMIIIERKTDIAKNIKLSGTVTPEENGFVRIKSSEGDALVNLEHSIIIRPDEEANVNVPKRGRKPNSSVNKNDSEKIKKKIKKEVKPTWV